MSGGAYRSEIVNKCLNKLMMRLAKKPFLYIQSICYPLCMYVAKRGSEKNNGDGTFIFLHR